MKLGGVVATKIDDWQIFKELEDLGYDSAWAPDSQSSRMSRKALQRIRVQALEASGALWPGEAGGFSIWGYGRDGKAVYKLLEPRTRSRVRAFLEVDPKKIGRIHAEGPRRIPVVPWQQAARPILVCVATGRGGALEANLASLGLCEGDDYLHFS